MKTVSFIEWCLFLALIMVVVSIGGCSDDNCELPDVSLAFNHLLEARFLQVQEPGTRVFHTSSEWGDFWTSHAEGSAPSIDFNNFMVIGLFWGSGYSGCSNFVFAIEEIVLRSGKIEVHVGDLPHLGDCPAFVNPIEVILLDRLEMSVSFLGEVPQ